MRRILCERRCSLPKAAIPLEQLGDIVGSLTNEAQKIIAARDELFSQAWK